MGSACVAKEKQTTYRSRQNIFIDVNTFKEVQRRRRHASFDADVDVYDCAVRLSSIANRRDKSINQKVLCQA